MKLIILLTVILMGIFLSDNITLEDLRWKNRVLLVFPGQNEETTFTWEMTDSLLAEIEERDLVYFVFGDTLTTNSSFSFDKDYKKTLRARYALGTKEMCWVLLGKDGGSKLRKEVTYPDWNLLFATIDAMPMRQREINRND